MPRDKQPEVNKQGSLPSNIVQLKEGSPFKQSYLSKRDHDDPENHYIGEGLPVSSVIRSASTTGKPDLGVSPIPAREDHVHGGALPIGALVPYAGDIGNGLYPGYLICQGQNASTLIYPDLFAVLGYKYGGSGTAFTLPDMRVRVPVGFHATNPPFDTLGNIGGTRNSVVPDHAHNIGVHTHGMKTHTHTMGNHTHGAGTLGFAQRTAAGSAAGAAVGNSTVFGTGAVSGATAGPGVNTTSGPDDNNTGTPSSDPTANAGVDGSDKNLQPYIVLNYLIRAY